MHPVIHRTGPNTPEGKAQRPLAAASEGPKPQRTCRGERVRFARSEEARSAANALKHGLTSRHVVLPGENRAEFDALVARLIEEHEATDTLEVEIIHEIAGCMWRLDRARKAESEYFHINFVADSPSEDTERRFALILRYTGAIEREFHRAITKLQQLKKERRQPQQTKVTTDHRPLTTEFVSQLTTDHRPLITKLTTDNRQLTTGNETPGPHPPDALAS